MHTAGCLPSVAHGEDDGGTAAHDISSGKDAGNVGLHALVHHDGILATQLQTLDGSGDNRVGGYAHGYDGHVDVQRFRGARYRFRTAATAGIRFAQLHLLQDHLLHRALFVGYVFQRVVQGEELDTFFLGVLHLFEAGRHLGFRTAIDNHHPFRTQAFGRAAGVHGGVATTDHDDLLADIERRLRVGLVGVHDVDAEEELVGGEDMDGVLAAK